MVLLELVAQKVSLMRQNDKEPSHIKIRGKTVQAQEIPCAKAIRQDTFV